MAGDATDAGADRLNRDHQRPGQHDRPEKSEARVGACLRVGRDAARIVVGGTGLYLKALGEGLAPVPVIPEALRAALRLFHAEAGDAALHARLTARDPQGAARLPPADVHRVLRALEVVEAEHGAEPCVLAAMELSRRMGKDPIRVKDAPGKEPTDKPV